MLLICQIARSPLQTMSEVYNQWQTSKKLNKFKCTLGGHFSPNADMKNYNNLQRNFQCAKHDLELARVAIDLG